MQQGTKEKKKGTKVSKTEKEAIKLLESIVYTYECKGVIPRYSFNPDYISISDIEEYLKTVK